MSYQLQSEPVTKQVAAWELVSVLIILCLMICYRLTPKSLGEKIAGFKFMPGKLVSFTNAVMGENYIAHTLLYGLLLVLVLSSVIMGFFNEEQTSV